ncbi:MlaA family lipoprotein [Vibrio diabolicus]|uniref:MlaA family lipoprotein n=1 Tax=Vibrio diabolicus TaxID=50719 RepID=UPI003F60681E
MPLFPGDEYEPFTARTLPTILTYVGAGLSLLLLVTGQPDKQSGAVLTFNWKLLIAFLVLMALYGVGLTYLGFVIATGFFLYNRFWINSTFGIFGLFDIASAAGITKYDEKAFSDAVGHYGVGNGPYFMIPGYGPYTLREVTDTVDSTYLPLSYLNFWASLGKWAFEGMEKRALLVPQEAQLESSPDPYILTRDVYIQRQNFKAEVETVEEVNIEEEEYLDEYLEDF